MNCQCSLFDIPIEIVIILLDMLIEVATLKLIDILIEISTIVYPIFVSVVVHQLVC